MFTRVHDIMSKALAYDVMHSCEQPLLMMSCTRVNRWPMLMIS